MLCVVFSVFFVKILAFLTGFFNIQYYLYSLCSVWSHGINHLKKKKRSTRVSVVIQFSHIHFVSKMFPFSYILIKMGIKHRIIMWNITL